MGQVIYELLGFNTEDPRDVRYRDYTTSAKRAEAFAQIPKIQFTDSGHGVVFTAREVAKRGETHKGPGTCRDHVRQHWKYYRW